METPILQLWTPDNGTAYVPVQDLARFADDVEEAILNPPYVRIPNTNLATFVSTNHPLQAGVDSAENTVMDRRGLIARNAGGTNTLRLNVPGGDVWMGNLDSRIIIQGHVDSTNLPWSMAAGEFVFAFVTSGTRRSSTITFPTNRFTAAPRVQATAVSNFPDFNSVSVSNVTATSMTVTYAYNGGGTLDEPRIHWTAFQMTSSSGSG